MFNCPHIFGHGNVFIRGLGCGFLGDEDDVDDDVSACLTLQSLTWDREEGVK